MTTIKLAKAYRDYIKKHKMTQSDYDPFKFNVGGKKVTRGSGWNRYTRWEGGYTIGCEIQAAPFCCGVYEIGSFVGGHAHKAHWENIIGCIIAERKLKYLRCETLTQDKGKNFKMLEAALVKLGFRIITEVPSSHNASTEPEKHYNIKVWEWLKKEE